MKGREVWKVIKRIWITVGVGGTIIFIAWSLIAFRANGEAHAAALSDARVSVTRAGGIWNFSRLNPATPLKATALIFFPGSLVDPTAYAPLARMAAEAGFPVYMVELPRRGAFGGADSPQIREHLRAVIQGNPAIKHWVLAGHSRGAVVACEMASEGFEGFAGLILIGTSHPRDVSLVALTIPVTKIVGSRDGLASPQEVEENKSKLPLSTRWVRIEGGNHSQFGWYGFQPGDRWAAVSAEAQRAEMLRAVLETLQSVSAP